MVRAFELPDVGEGLAEAEIVAWLVAPGDAVSEDQPVAEVETDKAVVEVPSPVNGTVRELHAEEGEMVPVGEVIVSFDVAGEAAVEAAGDDRADPDPEPDAGSGDGDVDGAGGRVFAAPSARRLARELGVSIDRIEGSGPGGRVTETDVRAAAGDGDAPAGVEGGAGGDDEPEPAVTPATRRVDDGSDGRDGDGDAPAGVEPAGRDRTLAAPATRRLAEEAGVDIDDVPTDERREGEPFVGPEQIRAYAEALEAEPEPEAGAGAEAKLDAEPEPEAEAAAGGRAEADADPGPEVGAASESAPGSGAEPGPGTADRPEERVPYRGVRRTIGRRMEESKYTAPHVTHHDTADATALVAARDRLREAAADRGVRLSYTPFVVKAAVAALREHPILNSRLDEEAGEIVKKGYYNVGIATATDAGLMVPVVEAADRKGLLEVARETNELVGKARDRSIDREEMQGGTFTITNFGAIGGEYATPIINYPETAILGLGEIRQRPRVVDGEVVPREVVTLSLSIDHRVIDGAEAAAFTNTLKRYLEAPELLLLE